MRRTFYFADELNDDFCDNGIDTKKLGDSYKYINRNIFFVVGAFLIYRVFATPVTYIFNKIAYGEKIVGRKKLRKIKKSGCFMYGNHTRTAGDAFTPSHVSFPKKSYIIANRDALSIKGLGVIVQMLGALPVPDSRKNYGKFLSAVMERAKKGNSVFVYPEAHIWPFYTKIRPFADTSFFYPVRSKLPAFSVTVTYKNRRLIKFPKAVVYIDGPFYPDSSLKKAEATKKLRDEVYNAMVKRSKNSDYEYHTYIKK